VARRGGLLGLGLGAELSWLAAAGGRSGSAAAAAVVCDVLSCAAFIICVSASILFFSSFRLLYNVLNLGVPSLHTFCYLKFAATSSINYCVMYITSVYESGYPCQELLPPTNLVRINWPRDLSPFIQHVVYQHAKSCYNDATADNAAYSYSFDASTKQHVGNKN